MAAGSLLLANIGDVAIAIGLEDEVKVLTLHRY